MFKLGHYLLDEETGGLGGGGGGSLLDAGGDDGSDQNNEDPIIEGKPEEKPEEGDGDKGDNTERPEWLPEQFESVEQYNEKFNSLSAAQSDAPDEYKFETPDGFQMVEGVENDIKGFMALAKDTNMSQEAFDKVMDFYVKSEQQKVSADLENRNAEAVEMFGGADLAKDRIATMNAKAQTTFNTETYELLKVAASNSPQSAGAAMRFAENVIAQFSGEPNQSAGNGGQHQSNHKTRDELIDMMKSDKYKKGDEATRKAVADGFKILNNEK